MRKFDWNHPAIQHYIAECKGLRIYWKTLTRVNLNRESSYYTALKAVRKYLDEIGYKMPRIKYENHDIEEIMRRKN